MKGFEVSTTVLLLVILVMVAYCAYVSTRVVTALQQVDESVGRATGLGADVINTAKRLLRIG
jgi:hypothetical protein